MDATYEDAIAQINSELRANTAKILPCLAVVETDVWLAVKKDEAEGEEECWPTTYTTWGHIPKGAKRQWVES
eukprot:7938566-Alexandrium_andersonii.AAC.1